MTTLVIARIKNATVETRTTVKKLPDGTGNAGTIAGDKAITVNTDNVQNNYIRTTAPILGWLPVAILIFPPPPDPNTDPDPDTNPIPDPDQYFLFVNVLTGEVTKWVKVKNV